VSGIWNEGEFYADTFKPRLIVFEVPLSASFWLSVMRDVKSRFFEACCERILMYFSLHTPQSNRRELERSLAAAQEEIAKLKSKCVTDYYPSSYVQVPSSCMFISYRSVNALKDREDRYRFHLNRQFETLSDAKNIEEQV
jgi:hypothetical protein